MGWVYPRYATRTVAEPGAVIESPEVPYAWVANVSVETYFTIPWPPGGVTGQLIKSGLSIIGLPRPRLR